MIEVEMPGGMIVEFPDGTPKEEMRRALQKRFGGQTADPRQYGGGDALRSGLMQGMTFNFGDEILAGMMTPIEMGIDAFQGKPLDIGRSYGQALDRNRATDKQMQAASPALATTGNIAGAVGSGLGLAKGGFTLMAGGKPTVASMATRGAAEGAAYGAISGAGAGEGLEDKASQALTGGALGGAFGGLAGGIGGALANRAVQKAVPSVDDLKSQAGAVYEAAKKSGITFSQPAVKGVADDIASLAIDAGIDPTLHPGAVAALKRLQDASRSGMTVGEAQTMRRVLAAAARDPMNPDQARIASIMVQKFDDFVGQSVPELAGANAIYSQAKKGELIETVMQRARDKAGANYTASGFENALRQEFKTLLLSKKALRGFSDAEVAAIRKVAHGGPIENVLRWMGRFSMGSPFSAGVTALGPATVGTMLTGNPVTGAALGVGAMGAGTLARGAATGMTLNNANMARMLALSGGSLPTSGAIPAATQGVIAGGGSQVPSLPLPSIPLPMLRAKAFQ